MFSDVAAPDQSEKNSSEKKVAFNEPEPQLRKRKSDTVVRRKMDSIKKFISHKSSKGKDEEGVTRKGKVCYVTALSLLGHNNFTEL